MVAAAMTTLAAAPAPRLSEETRSTPFAGQEATIGDIGVLTVVVVLLAALVARRILVLVRTWDTGRQLGTLMLVISMAALGVAGFYEYKHQWTQARATAVVEHVSGVRTSVAHCQRFTPELLDVSQTSGYVSWGDDGVAQLRRTVCNDLFSWLSGSKDSPTRAQAIALHVTVHEAMHVAGVREEAKAECYAMQHDADAARFLGATPAQAQALVMLYYRNVYPQMSPDYSSAECAPDQGYDLTPGDGHFP